MTQRITRSHDGEDTNPSPSSQFKSSNGTGASSSALAQGGRPSAATPTSMYPGGAMPCPTRSSGAGVGAAGKAMMGIGVACAAAATRGACAKATTRRANVVIVASRRSTRPTASGAFSDNALIVGRTYIVGADKGRAGCSGLVGNGAEDPTGASSGQVEKCWPCCSARDGVARHVLIR
jgi:hypothetical protein